MDLDDTLAALRGQIVEQILQSKDFPQEFDTKFDPLEVLERVNEETNRTVTELNVRNIQLLGYTEYQSRIE